MAATAKQLGEMGLVLDIFPLTEVINDVIMLYYDHRDAADTWRSSRRVRKESTCQLSTKDREKLLQILIKCKFDEAST